MTKPIPGRAASACHVHQALYDAAGENVFDEEGDPDGLSETCRRGSAASASTPPG